MPENRAAYLEGPKVRPLGVRKASYTSPGPDEIVVKNGAIALNPLEYIKQDLGNFLYSWIKGPFVMGSDCAGVVVEVGSNVTRFKAGDHVVGHALGMEKKFNKSSMGAFQLYTVLLASMTSQIPETLEFEKATVLPLGLSTASCGLFQKDQLALRHPIAGKENTGTRELLIVWGGSSSVGCNAIQLAVAAGYEVVTTCSPRNFALVKSLGAKAAFDYNSKTIVQDITSACQGKKVAGAMIIGSGGAEACSDVLGKCEGNRFMSLVSFPTPANKDAGTAARIMVFASFFARMMLKNRVNGVKSKFVLGSTLEENEVAKAVYEDYLPAALARGEYVCAPEPRIIGTKLEVVQDGLDLLRKGVSAAKLVVKL